MLSSESLLDKWNGIANHTSGYVRIDSDHPMEWSIGYESIIQKSLLLITESKPRDLPSSKSIQVSYAQRATDNKWAITFRLTRAEQENVYVRLCFDLIESSRTQTDSVEGLEYVLDRYIQWSKLLELQKSGLLSEAERKGLIGEINYLQQIISLGVSPLSAVTSWIGPEGADQDFVDEYGWHEIKASGIGAKTVSISSLEQLDALAPGELVLYFIDKTSPNDANSFTLQSKVNNLRDLVRSNVQALDLFNKKLLQYGYIDIPDYSKQWYRFGGSNRYRIDEHFPKLIKGNVPSQIAAASYQISIQAIEGWKIS
ncbi:PD-(D/E)XK motif protein [Cohnella sp. CFH 77786]|uniref:PD-(D/E)XK motif protein n=1 Tax=Cohnella sp. CFH 77786 TaxID=2662265 RepID=UPI002106BD7B|nr:PD-(D/E)XK motif protein [Cohnella sp. CFH 77786]